MTKETLILPIGCDHAGFGLKEFLKKKLTDAGYTLRDFGTWSAESMDYPDVAHPLSRAVNEGVYPMGILICGSGAGMSMVANKYPNVRAGICWMTEIARLARAHNNANIICLPARFIMPEEAWGAVQAFLQTPFEGGRHERRVEKITGGL